MKIFARTVHSLLMAIMLVLFVFENFMVFVVASIMKTVSSSKTFVLVARWYLIGRTSTTHFMDILPCHAL
jgi:hypothetical protein